MMLRKERPKEERVIVLDYLQHGYPMDPRPAHRKTAIAQAIGKNHFTLLELVPKKEVFLQPHEEVYIGSEKREKIHHILGKLPYDKLTATARNEMEHVVKKMVEDNEARFVDFFNKSQPLGTRIHQIELLPGIGKKHMWEILEARKEKEFTSFDDIKQRVKLMPDPKAAIIKRIVEELEGREKHLLFVGA